MGPNNRSTSPRDALEVAFVATLCPLREKLRRCYDNELTAFGLSRSLAAPLVRIWQNDGMRQNALADQMDIEGPSLVRLLDQLSGSGLVVRRPDPDDQRARTLHLTPAGVELAERIIGYVLEPLLLQRRAHQAVDGGDEVGDFALAIVGIRHG